MPTGLFEITCWRSRRVMGAAATPPAPPTAPALESSCDANPVERGGLYPGTADLIELLERLDQCGVVRGRLCRYTQIAVDRGYIGLSAIKPSQLPWTELFRARQITARVTEAGHRWMDERLGLRSPTP